MKQVKKLRIRVNSQAIVQLTGLLSNSIILSANAFLLGHNVRKQMQERRIQAIADKLQIASEVTSAIAGLAKVVVNVVDRS